MSQVALREEKTSINAVAFGRTDSGSGLAPQNLGDIVRFAEVMSRADIAIPKHLRENPGACLAVCMQAFKWEMDPFAVAQKSYKVGDQMAYEAQLIAAVINTRAGLKKRPQIEYQGEGQDRKCIVTFQADDGSVHVYESPRFAAITTKNSPLWKSDPDQQLGYYSIRAGARRHFPEVILGVYDRDEIAAARDVTPAPERPSLADRMAAAKATGVTQDKPEGFDRSFIDGELRGAPETATAEETASAEDDGPLGGGETTDATDEDTREVAVADTSQQSEADAAPAAGESDKGEIDPDAPAAEHEDAIARSPIKLISYARAMFLVAGGDGDAEKKLDRLEKTQERWRPELKDNLDEADLKKAQSIFKSAQAVATDKADLDAACDHFSGLLGCQASEIMPKGGE